MPEWQVSITLTVLAMAEYRASTAPIGAQAHDADATNGQQPVECISPPPPSANPSSPIEGPEVEQDFHGEVPGPGENPLGIARPQPSGVTYAHQTGGGMELDSWSGAGQVSGE